MFNLTLKERDRRWNKVREAMEKRELECLVIWGSYGRFGHFGANLRYLSNISAEGYLVFPLKGDPTRVQFFARPDPTEMSANSAVMSQQKAQAGLMKFLISSNSISFLLASSKKASKVWPG